jgi:hypothetical protein
LFVDYQSQFGNLQKIAKQMLEALERRLAA